LKKKTTNEDNSTIYSSTDNESQSDSESESESESDEIEQNFEDVYI